MNNTNSFIKRIRNSSHFNVVAGVVVTIAVAAVGYTLFFAHAAGPFAIASASGAAVSGNATLVTDTTSPQGGKVLQFGSGQTGGTGGSGTYSCIKQPSDLSGLCNFSAVPYITGAASDPWVGQNIWSSDGKYQQTLYANSPKDWYITANANTNFGGVLTYPNTGFWMGNTIDSYSSITSSWNVTIPTDSSTVAGWAAYDLWFNNWADEVMVQTDLTANNLYDCPSDSVKFTNVSIDGQPWHMCQFGYERVMKPGATDSSIRNATSGTVNIKDILKYLEANNYIPASSTWTAGSFGFEVCDTGGKTVTFKVNDFSWNAQ